jgi:hypothetical protein
LPKAETWNAFSIAGAAPVCLELGLPSRALRHQFRAFRPFDSLNPRLIKDAIENSEEPHQNAVKLFGAVLRRSAFRAGVGLVIEYLTFASAVFLALLLFATRIPLGFLDRAFGFRIRQRVVDALARVSPG